MIHKDITKLSVDIDSVEPHPRNVRQGDVGAISESLEHNGQYRPIVVQRSSNKILAGNHTWKAAKALGWKKIAVTYVDVDDEKALRILIADNRTNDLASYDNSALAELLTELATTEQMFEGTGFDGSDVDDLIKELSSVETEVTDNAYTQKVKVPHYEIVGDKPHTDELIDLTRYRQLVENIQKHDLPEDVASFLMASAWRHARFNYRKIAEYYPHQTPEVQKLMEESVLVIIDADDAIANGYAKFALTMEEIVKQDDDNE
jgi:ParB/RepB/Spo0J family partition protein